MSSSPAAERRWSVGRRIALWYAASAILLMVLTVGFLDRTLRGLLEEQADRTLSSQLAIIQKLLHEEPTDLADVRHEVEVELGANPWASAWLRVYDRDGGAELAHAAGMPALADAVPPPAEGLSKALEVRGPDGAPYRLMAVAVRSGHPRVEAGVAPLATGPRTWVVQGVYAFAREAELLEKYRRQLLAVLALAAFATVPLGLWIARRSLVAVHAMSDQVRGLSSETLHRRLEVAGLPAELTALAEVFNATLDRLERSFEQLSRFSSDLAHELRTPLANLRGEAEVALARPREPERYREVLVSALDECERMSGIVDRLLFLARAESTRGPFAREPLAVAAELERVREYYAPAAEEAGVRLTVEAAPATAPLDGVLFNRAVSNLVANALEYTPRDGRVVVTAREVDGALEVAVADTGSGIPPEHLPRVFERFHRVDPARARGTGGVGLGLAIVQSIARLHGGKAAAESEPGRGTTVRLILPLEIPSSLKDE